MCMCLYDQIQEEQITICESHTSHFTMCICSVEHRGILIYCTVMLLLCTGFGIWSFKIYCSNIRHN